MNKIEAEVRNASVRLADLAGWLTVVDPLLVEFYFRAQGRAPEPHTTQKTMGSVFTLGMNIIRETVWLIVLLPLLFILLLRTGGC